MMNSTRWIRYGVVALILTGGIGQAAMARERPAPKQLYYEAAYVREVVDRPWTLRLGGGVASRPGCFVVIHDAGGRLFLKHHVPYRGQAAGKPQTIRVPADGITGDYRIVFVGFQNDSYNIDLPLTDLPLEVYGRRRFATHSAAPLYLRPTPGVKELTFSSHSGGLRIMLNGKTIADTANDDPNGPRFRPATFTVKPGATYQVEAYGCFYFGSATPVFLTHDIARWFVPDANLEKVKWWQLPKP